MAKHRYWRLFMADSYFPDNSANPGGVYANMQVQLARVMFRETLDKLPLDRQMVLDGSYCPGVATASSTGNPAGNSNNKVSVNYLFGSTAQMGNFGGDYTELGNENPTYMWNSAVGAFSTPYSGVTNQWVQYDYTSNSAYWQDINVITLVSPNDAVTPRQSLANWRLPKNCKVQWSDNGTTWTDHFSFVFQQLLQGVHQTFYHPSIAPRTNVRKEWTVQMNIPLQYVQTNQAGDGQVGIWLKGATSAVDGVVSNTVKGTSTSPIFRYHLDKYVGKTTNGSTGFLPGSTGTKMVITSEADIPLEYISMPRIWVINNNPSFPNMTWPRPTNTISVLISNNLEGITASYQVDWGAVDWDGRIFMAYQRAPVLMAN